MATAEAETGEAEVQTIEPETLLPVRIKSRGQPVIGDDEKTLSRPGNGFTKAIVYATAESILKCPVMRNQDLGIIAGELNEELLEFDTYEEEVNSRFGRAPLKIVLDEGVKAYEEIQGKFNNNAYLHAALYDLTVMEAAEELDTQPTLVVDTGDGFTDFSGGYGSPTIVAAATVGDDGEIRDTDLREFSPDLEWVVDNWTTTGGHRRHTRQITNRDEDVQQLYALASPDAEGEVRDSVVNKSSKGDFTIHYIRDLEESIVADENDQVVAHCGARFDVGDKITRLSLDDGRIKNRLVCGSCGRVVE